MKKTSFFLILSIFLLTGCWDQQQLKHNRLALGIGLDELENGDLLQTTDIQVPKQDSGGTGRPVFTSVIMKSTGATLLQTRMNLENEIAGNYAPNKLLVYVLGEELAKKDIYPIFDVLYRYPRNSLGAKLVIAKGKAEDIISLEKVEEKLITDALLKVIVGAEEDSIIPNLSIQSVCPIIFNEGQDFALPMIDKSDNNQIKISGLSLFHEDKYTGVTISEEDSSILLLLNNEQTDLSRLSLKVNPEENRKINQFVSLLVSLKKHDLKVKLDSGNHVTVGIKIKLNIHIVEYPKDKLANKKELNRLSKKINIHL